LGLEELPPRIVFVGGGYIAFEFAHIAARAGARVQVLHRGARPLEKFEADLVVHAAGDAVASGGFPLTPVAGMQGDIVVRNLLEGNRYTTNYTGIPSVVFTTPPLARVGLDEAAAHAQGLRFRTHREDTSGWYSLRRVAQQHTGSKVLIEEGTDRILGAHLLGLHAEEIINLFALAIRAGLRTSDLKAMVYSYPISASDIGYML
jgi:glutathione reductase (NADPH)